MNKFYITAAIPYVNARPHLGHALLMINTDVVARYRRLQGDDVRFVTGTDEHGVKNVRAAEKADISVREFVNKNSAAFHDLLQKLTISNDDFIRTSDEKRHFPGAQKLWTAMKNRGDIYKGFYKGLYCVGHEAFVTEKDLVAGKCEEHDAVPEIIEEENYFFRLSKYQKDLEHLIEKNEIYIVPETRKNEVLAFIKEGLEDISFSRPSKDIEWGVPVPDDNMQTMYVWCDALSNYITSLGYGGDDESLFQKYWPADVQVIGKDILRFHGIFWPAMLLSAGLTLPNKLLVHGFVNVGGRKMSKTIGNVADPFALVEKYGVDALRFYLLHEVPTFGDGDFTEENFARAYEAYLVNGFGNTVSRIAKMIEMTGGALDSQTNEELVRVPFRFPAGFSGKSLEEGEETKLETVPMLDYIRDHVEPAFARNMDNLNLHGATIEVWTALNSLNQYIQDWKPFDLLKSDPEKSKLVLRNATDGLLRLARLVSPIMPTTADRIFLTFGVDSRADNWNRIAVSPQPHLFPRIK